MTDRDLRRLSRADLLELLIIEQQELDRLLDKISREGINSLSEEEMARLRQARVQMRGGR